METATNVPTCPQCHVPVRPIDYFCYNCGATLHPKPLPVSIEKQLMLYTGSVILLPMGIVWGFRYLRQPGTKSKIVGTVCIIISIITMTYVTLFAINFINTVQDELHRQLQNVGY